MKKLFTLLTLLLCAVSGVWADNYAPTGDEVIILNDVYDANKTDAGYSKHAAVAWAGTASAGSKKCGDPYNNGEATAESVPCFSVKGNGKGKNITISISGVSKIIVYHESHGSRYVELRSGKKDGTLIGKGEKATYFTEVELDGKKNYSIFLHGTDGSGDQDIFVYAVKLIQYIATDKPTITTQPVGGVYASTPFDALTVVATASGGDLSYQWYKCDDANKTNAAAIAGATNASYTPTAIGYYYVTVSDANGSVDSDVVQILLETAPGISINNYIPSTPRGAAVTFVATTTGAPEPTVTWYQSETATNSGGTEKGTGETYKPDVTTIGTYYYYAVASNGVTPDATSNVITLTVTNPDVDRTGYNSYYVAENDVVVSGEQVFCDNITMEYGQAVYDEAVANDLISDINANYVASISSPSSNGWGVTFTPSSDGVLSVGVIINGNKTFSITNVSSFEYNGNADTGEVDGSGLPITTPSSGTIESNEWTPAKKQYTIITISVTAGKTYFFSVAGSKMAFYGFEFTPTNVSPAIGSTGWATFVAPAALDFTGISDLKAYIVTGHTDAAITVEQMTGTVPANTPLLLEGVTTAIPIVASSSTDVSANLLKAGGAEVSPEDGKTKYALSVAEDKAVFKKIVAATAIPAGKAYLEFTGDVPAPSLSFGSGETTGISTTNFTNDTNNGEYYNLAGQRVAQPTKGLYIVNGKKYMVK